MEIDLFTPFAERIDQITQKYDRSTSIARRFSIFRHACASLDVNRLEALRAKWIPIVSKTDKIGYTKYFDVIYWLWEKSAHIEALNLDQSPPKKILDLGSGPGHFTYMCRIYGHDAIGIDLEYDIFRDICHALHVEYHAERLTPEGGLPDLGRHYDLVSALMLKFDQIEIDDAKGNRVRYWSGQEWTSFFRGIVQHLNPGAEIFLELNKHHQMSGPLMLDHLFVDACKSQGASQLGKDYWLHFKEADQLHFNANYPSQLGVYPSQLG